MARPNRGAANSASACSCSSSCTLMSTLWLLFLSLSHAPAANALPTGFVAEVVSQVKATTGRFAPHPQTGEPMLLVVAKNGEVHVVQDFESGTDDGQMILDLRGNNQMCTNGERGLQSIEVHPNFSDNRWVYLYYNQYQAECLEDANNGPHNVLARYTMNADTLELENEEILMEGAAMDERVHNGGALLFSSTDQKLYLTTGDAGAGENAQNLKNLHGSLLRLNDDGTVPSDNPFVEDGTGVPCGPSGGRLPKDAPDDAVCSEIWAWGFRNPFRMSPDSDGRIVISDVGAQFWEELSWGGSDYRAVNYGWPNYEGPCRPATVENCEPPPEGSNNMQPFHFYQHKSFEDGGCVAGTTVVPENIWPDEFKFLFIDFIFLKIYNLVEDASAECLTCSPPTSGYRNETFYESIHEDDDNVNEARMVDMFFGPYQDTLALYVIKFGNNDSLIRIRYTGSVNVPPLPKIVIQNPSQQQQQDEDHILVGNVVQFDGSQSSDPDGETLSYQWNFGDGDNSTSKSPSHVYNSPGEYRVILIVRDADDQAQQESVTVVVGQPPSASIVSPDEGAYFDVGQELKLLGLAYDSNGDQIPDDQIMWEVRQHHADHFHPFLDETIGNSIDLYPAPEPEDFFASTNSFLKVIMKATDSNGLTTEVFRDVHPRTVTVDIQTEPDGLEVAVDGYVVVAHQEIVSWVNFELPLRVHDQPPFVFQEWGDGSTSHSLNITLSYSDEKQVFVAKFCLERNSFCGKSSICCSGVCSERGLCEDSPQTRPPFSTGISDNEYFPNEDDVNDTIGEIPELPGVGDPLEDDAVDYQSITRNHDGLGPSEKWLLSLLTIVVVVFPICMGLIYCRRGGSGTAEGVKRSLDEGDDSQEEQTPMTSRFATPGKESISVIGASLSEGASSFTSAIWEKLAEENERRAKLRAKLGSSNFRSEDCGVTSTPETMADSPTSTKSFSSGLSASIDETLVRLDDILSRTFQFSRNRRSEQLTPEKPDVDAVAESAAVGSPESDMEDVYLDSSSQLLLPLGDSRVPDSPLREDPVRSFAVDTVGYSFVSSGLEDGLNDSAVHVSDTHSVHSGSGRLLCQDPTVPTSLLDVSEDKSAAESVFFPVETELADTYTDADRQSVEGYEEVTANNESCDTASPCNTELVPARIEAVGVPQEVTAIGDSTLEPPSFFDASNGDTGEESASNDSDEGDSSDDDVKDETQVEHKSFFSADSVSGHSLV